MPTVKSGPGAGVEDIGAQMVKIKNCKVAGDLRRKLVGMGLLASEEA